MRVMKSLSDQASAKTMSEFNFSSVVQVMLCLLAVVMGSVVIISFSVYAPFFVSAFEVQVATVSLAASIVLLVTGVASPVIGRILDSRSVRSVFLIGGVLLVIGLAGMSFAGNAPQLHFFYGVMGLAMAIYGPMVAVKHMADWFRDNLGLATSLACLPVGAVLFPPLTNWLIEAFDWRQSFKIYAIAALIVTVLMVFIKASQKNTPATNDQSSDVAEEVIPGSPSSGSVVYKTLCRSGLFWFGLLAFSVFMAAGMTNMTHFVIIAETKGLTASDGVLFLTIMGGFSMIGGPLAGVVSDRYGPRLGFVLMCTGLIIALLLIVGESGYSQFIISSVILGLMLSAGYIFFVGYVTVIIGQVNFGTGFGFATFVAAIVGAFPPTIAGAVFDAYGTYDLHFLVLVALALLVLVITWKTKPPKEVEYT